jgi:hypothetical protein
MQRRKPLLYIYYGRPLKGEHAFMMADFLESVVSMLWREFGDDMADFQGQVFPNDPPSQYGSHYCKKRRSDDDDSVL